MGHMSPLIEYTDSTADENVFEFRREAGEFGVQIAYIVMVEGHPFLAG